MIRWILVMSLLVGASCSSDEARNLHDFDAGDTADAASSTDVATAADAGRDSSTAADDGTVEDTSETPDMATMVDAGPLGGDRPADVVLPSNWRADGSYPVVVLLHGLSANSALQDAYFHTSALVDELQFVLVLPDGNTNSSGAQFWNATDGCCDLENTGVDDSTYLSDLAQDAIARYAGDPKRLYFYGHSNGGYMSYRLACDHSDQIAGIASLAGSTWADEADCGDPGPLTVVQIHGTLDALVNYYGLLGQPGAEEVVNRWVARDGCTAGPDDLGTADYDPGVIGEETSKQAWTSCEAGTEVQLWTMTGSGHIPIVPEQFSRDVLTYLFAHPRP